MPSAAQPASLSRRPAPPATPGGDKNTVWDFRSGPSGSTPTLTVGHRGTITVQAWQPDGGGWLATGARDGRIQVCKRGGGWRWGAKCRVAGTVGHAGWVSWQPRGKMHALTKLISPCLPPPAPPQVHDITDAVAMRPGMPLICQPGILGVTDGAPLRGGPGLQERLDQAGGAAHHAAPDP